MRPMRRQDRAVTAPEKVRAVIDACEVCRLGLQDGRGVYVVPVNFGHTVEGGRHVFYFHGAAEGRKVDLVRRNGWAGFELDTGYRLQGAEAACGYTAAFQSVIGEGPIRVVETAEERRRGLAAIMRQATCCGDWTFPAGCGGALLQGAPIIRLGGDGMRRIWLGFAWILFGILLVLVGFEPPALTILSWMRAYWAPVGLLCGIIGLVLVLLDNKNKD